MTQARKITGLAIPIVFASILLGGCGNGDRKPLTKTEFASKANAICAPLREKVASVDASTGSLKEDATITAEALPLMDDQVARLKKLVPPAGQQKTFDRV
ncbi:MAG: hypothetical protein ACYDHO_07470, partial [Gaiellaceae bacterium]